MLKCHSNVDTGPKWLSKPSLSGFIELCLGFVFSAAIWQPGERRLLWVAVVCLFELVL